ncbi:cytochrome P450 76A2-like [Nicotiana tomentosiformis]|uniref:cytochrome P450 76A2-like n=1 Tax=Nicotiana tomentosiformis TaxID=4098 RepID=UPI00388C46E4
MFIAASETTNSSSDWALTELLCNPESMARAKAEITEGVGNKKFEESDIDNLHYMQAVVKETLRLHPPVPFLVPKRAIKDTSFMGYDIPEDTQVFVNVWAIGRDPEFWEDPLTFRPERFLGSNIYFKGQCFEFIPFGAGRRTCVGLILGNRIMLQEFDWELPDNVRQEWVALVAAPFTSNQDVVSSSHPKSKVGSSWREGAGDLLETASLSGPG